MAVCLFRLDDEPLPVKDLRRLADQVADVTPYDASRMAERTVLVEDLTGAAAERIQLALAELGHPVDVVSDAWLKLPRERRCRRARVTAAGLVVEDTHGDERRIDWDAVRVVAAGCAPNTEQLSLALITTAPVARYVIDPDVFDGRAEGASSLERLAAWLRDVVAHAPRVTLDLHTRRWLERGRPVPYSTLHGMDRSLAWQLWRHHGAGAASRGDLDARTTPFVERDEDKTFTERARARSAERVIESYGQSEATHNEKRKRNEALLAVLILGLWVLTWNFGRYGSYMYEGELELLWPLLIGGGVLGFSFWRRWG